VTPLRVTVPRSRWWTPFLAMTEEAVSGSHGVVHGSPLAVTFSAVQFS
jgi:hypothetical protein